MSTVVKDLGAATAYGYAVEKGYTGTEEEFAELMASYATVGQTAVDAKDAAVAAKTAAQTAATTATNKASEATTAAQTATTKAGEASTSASTATSAKDTAVSAKTAAQTAQTGAETARDAVQSSAAQIATNAEDITQLKEDLIQWANIVNNVQYYGLLAVTGGPGAVPEGTPTHMIGYNANSSSVNYKRIIYYNGESWANFHDYTIDDLPIDIVAQATIMSLNTFKEKASLPVEWAGKVSKYITPFANLFNNLDSDILYGHYISGSGYPEDANYNVTGYIPVDDSKTYTYKIYTSLYGSNSNRLQCFDGSLNRLGYSVGTITGEVNTATPLEGTKYVRVAVSASEMDTFMVVEGSEYPATYKSYGVEVFGYMSPLYGKKLCCEGDSIMKGAGNNGVSFATMIAERNNMVLDNNAVSGATICSGTTDSGGNNKHWISTSMENLDSDGDYYIFDGYVNDVNSLTTIGTITYGYDNTLDTTTFCGAFEQCCKTLVTVFAGKKVGYVLTHRIWNPNDTLANSFVENMIKILNKWGVPYINLMDDIPSLNLISSLKSVYTKDGDGWHPNGEGYKAYYVDKVEAWLETL